MGLIFWVVISIMYLICCLYAANQIYFRMKKKYILYDPKGSSLYDSLLLTWIFVFLFCR